MQRRSDPRNTGQLKISQPNAKTRAHQFNLPAGFTCPCASICLAKADRNSGEVKRGKDMQVQCYAASEESRWPTVRKARWWNFNILRQQASALGMAGLLIDAIRLNVPIHQDVFRIHASGDFFSEEYFGAWMMVAEKFPDITFYGYTKRIGLLQKYGQRPVDNMRVVASIGGTEDHLIDRTMVTCNIVLSEEHAEKICLPVDYDDSRCMACDHNFAVLIHGVQPKGTPESKASYANRGKSHRKMEMV